MVTFHRAIVSILARMSLFRLGPMFSVKLHNFQRKFLHVCLWMLFGFCFHVIRFLVQYKLIEISLSQV